MPRGWRLVPDTPTVEWIEAMHRRTSYPQVRLAIEMMLATAPQHTAENQTDDGPNSHEKLASPKPANRPRRSGR